MEKRKNWGGRRQGAGRRTNNIHLTKDTAKSLALLTKQRRTLSPEITEEVIVAELIEAAWRALDAKYVNELS